jgi:hypothetical protein
VDRIEDLRREHKWTARQIHLGLVREGHRISPVTVAWWLRRVGISRRRDIDRHRRYQPQHQDRGPLCRAYGPPRRQESRTDPRLWGWCAHGRGSDAAKAVDWAKNKAWIADGNTGVRAGHVYLHSAVDGFSRLAHTDAPPNGTVATMIGFWARVRAFFAAHGVHRIIRVVTDNGSDDQAKNFTRTSSVPQPATSASDLTPRNTPARSNALSGPSPRNFSTPVNGPQEYNAPPRSRRGTSTTTTIEHILRSGANRRPHASTTASPTS